jgi:hypothetical protein
LARSSSQDPRTWQARPLRFILVVVHKFIIAIAATAALGAALSLTGTLATRRGPPAPPAWTRNFDTQAANVRYHQTVTIAITGPERKVPWQNAVVGFIIAVFVIGVCLILLWLASDFLVDWLWFSSINYLQVFWTTIGAKAVVFFAVWTATAVTLWLNGWLAVRFARWQPTQALAASSWNPTGKVPPPDLFTLMRDRLPWRRAIAGGAGYFALLVAAGEVGNWGVYLQYFYQYPMVQATRSTARTSVSISSYCLPISSSRTGCCSQSF